MNCKNHDGELWDITRTIYIDETDMASDQKAAIACALKEYQRKLKFFK